jgi:hypothetical protein
MKKYKYRSLEEMPVAFIKREKTKRSRKEREKTAWYMKRRRDEIKAGIRIPTPSDLRTKCQNPHYHREYARRQREMVIKNYGNKCVCCGEKNYYFLSIDHINGGGNKHRKEIGGNFYGWLIRNKFPKGFQVLCYNCNFAKGHYEKCPHELIKILTK